MPVDTLCWYSEKSGGNKSIGCMLHCWKGSHGFLQRAYGTSNKNSLKIAQNVYDVYMFLVLLFLSLLSPRIQCRQFYNSKLTAIRILVKFLLLGHVLHSLLQGSDAAGPVLSLFLALAEEMKALAGPFEDHCQTPALRY